MSSIWRISRAGSFPRGGKVLQLGQPLSTSLLKLTRQSIHFENAAPYSLISRETKLGGGSKASSKAFDSSSVLIGPVRCKKFSFKSTRSRLFLSSTFLASLASSKFPMPCIQRYPRKPSSLFKSPSFIAFLLLR
ncbi:LOW QUALITY PROTEIN: hypothetical protein TorRG33x02_116460 [Trema orientale]|uniref:Uncharacterized protein n=1 Tax=Trema orientale TaxID=63057 RepID=A0A2P5F465_TREOI|nr:LOW QUALITY PROTEIN: hypothetical protein TorRG33x02_116460 [Trema orientale]